MAMILDAFLPMFGHLVKQMIEDEVGMLLGVPSEIEKLEKTVHDIRCVHADAEKKKIESKLIESWLMELKNVMYDADDILDLCQIKYEEHNPHSDTRSSIKHSFGCLHLLSCFRNPAFAHEIGTKIKEINVRLEVVANRKYTLGLNVTEVVDANPHSKRVDSIIHCKTDSKLVMDDLVGEKLEEDAKLLVSWLIEEGGVMVVQGMGGIGKTTLAKRIFNDSKVTEEFKLKIWTCVSKNVNGVQLLQSIIVQAGGEAGVTADREVLVGKLENLINGKKFLLVLDDVWPESVAAWNELLCVAMNGGDRRSRLLVTTRDERVANDIKATNIHRVGKLSEKDGWLLLKKQVFKNDQEDEIQAFKNIGMELVRKCDGLPLAIKSIGGVLRMRRKKTQEWKAVLRSGVWSMNGLPDTIHQALYLSYVDLPSPIKQCFIICSFYPEDYMYKRTNLIYHWIAEGFLQGIENPWEKANDYFNELLVRNLLEDLGERYGEYENNSWSKMHDLWWSFAHYLGKEENYILTRERVLNGHPVTLRRLSTQENNVNLQDIKKQNRLRTLFIDNISENVLTDLCITLRYLRILVLQNNNIWTLPNSLSSLVHLRYFDVSGSQITIVPEFIGYLKNLVYLNFSDCRKLTHVHNNIIYLKKLMYLSFLGTEIVGIPSGLKNFEKLIHLFGFKPDNNSLMGLSGIEELEPLMYLVTLQLQDLDKVTDINLAKRAKLYFKEQLQDLSLFFSYRSRKAQVSQTNEKKLTAEAILNELSPPCSVEILKIHSYFGSTLPKWLNLEADLPNLRYLEVYNCNCFASLVPLGQLPSLEFLKIGVASSIVTIGEEFLWGDIKRTDVTIGSCYVVPAFPKLNELWFEELSNWKEWQWNKGVLAMPKLKKLVIEYCPKLNSLPEGLSHHATSLEHLHIFDANNLTQVVNFLSTQEITVQGNQNLEIISDLPSVSKISIDMCPKLKIVENLSALETMELFNYEMEALPEYLMTTTPSKLTIKCSEELLQEIKNQGNDGSNWHKFEHIREVNIYSKADSLIDLTNMKKTVDQV